MSEAIFRIEQQLDGEEEWSLATEEKTQLAARRKAAILYGKDKAAKFRVVGPDGIILFEIGKGSVAIHKSIAPKRGDN